MNKVFVDFETSGKDPLRNDIIEFGAIVADEALQALDEFHSYARPTESEWWDEEAEEVHGISKEFLVSQPSIENVISGFHKFLEQFAPLSFVCHSGHYPFVFDLAFLKSAYLKYLSPFDLYSVIGDPAFNAFSTVNRSKNYARSVWGVENQKLSTWMNKLGIEDSKHHSALFDARVCFEVFKFQESNKQWGYGQSLSRNSIWR